jgi:hypothetical protein
MYKGFRVKYSVFLSDILKIDFSRQIFEKFPNTIFHEKSDRWELSCSMRTDRHDEANSRFPQF